MKHVEHTEWERLKLHAAVHLESKLWMSGTFCISSDPVRAPDVWVPQISASSVRITR